VTGLFGSEPFAVAPSVEPKMSADRKRTFKRQQLIARGIHPATKVKLLDNGETCGSCIHSVKADDRWWKCELVSMSRGAGSDIRVSWPACQKWEFGNE
jgi:hypothetical protein